ncbi:receptor-type tyrosine-protein phosphatase C-like [Triplophysa dalaica]|uniref:receptor-type tyrosine-protein phosphatase C-like n=1 Tax=Triplophysa dalaica TaxID=1582913 RepID=UPI0024DFD29C|nr:receptor-type tyrosine-protein phosphatase C-like [Triplophysa dalaica]
MARFFGLGPLILVLCVALCNANTETTNPTPTSAKDLPTDTTGVGSSTETTETVQSQTIQTSSPSLTPSLQHNNTDTEGNVMCVFEYYIKCYTISDDHQVSFTVVTSPSPARTPSLTSQTEDQEGSGSESIKSTQTIQTSSPSPSLTPSHQHNNTATEVTSPSPALTPSLISQTEDKVGSSSENIKPNQTIQTSSPSLTPSLQHNNTATEGNVMCVFEYYIKCYTISDDHQVSFTVVTSPSPALTPSLTSQTEDQVGSSSENIKPNQTIQTSSPSLTPSLQHDHTSTEVTGPLPARTSPPTSQPEEKGAENKTTSLANTTSSNSSTVLPSSTTITPSTDPAEPKCNFTAAMTKYGAEVEIFNGSDNATYTVTIRETTKNVITIKGVKENVTIPFHQLKPCTNYTVEVKKCSESRNVTFNTHTDEKSVSHSVKYLNDTVVCYKDGKWNLRKCVEIKHETACKTLPLNVTLDTCNYTIMAMLPPDKPNITYTETIPTQFMWHNKSQHCNDTQMQVKCTRDSWSRTFALNQNVSFLPNKEYKCTGEYPFEKNTTKSEEIQVNITCDWQKNKSSLFKNITSRSFVMSWKSQNDENCPGIELYYEARCNNGYDGKNCTQNKNKTSDTDCSFHGLKPYTIYKCEIRAKVNTSDQSDTGHYIISTGEERTLPDKPILIESFQLVHLPSHNSINVECKGINQWNGGTGNYIAKLKNKGITEKSETNKSCSFTFKDLYYLTDYTIEVTAKNEQGIVSDPLLQKKSTKYSLFFQITTKAVIGFLAFLIILTSIALLFVLYKIFILKRKRNDREDDVIPLIQPLRNVEPILADNLVDAYKKKVADEGRLFMDEFQSIPRIFSNYTIKEAKKQGNQSRNRYVDILPYDYNRVVLSTDADNDYINASFIEGYKEPKKYIAAQGPKDETIDDFWRMIWEQKSSIIVMVTRCEEGNKSKCAQYWPYLERETEIYEDFVVKIRSEEHCPDYIIRHLLLSNKREKASEREVTQIQFISWPDHGVPGDPSLLLKLRRRVNSFKNFFSGPIVVHCSAGVGRTGTYTCIDAMIESLEAEGRMDIYGYVAKLRRQRCLMVQVEAQYILIHQALIEHNQFGETEIPLSEFHSQLNGLRQKDGDDPSLLELEYQKLPKFKNWRTFKTASSEENKKKNRMSSVVPYDFNRVLFRLEMEPNQTSDPEDEDEYSSSEDEEESNEYINASFINGYWCPKSLIAAQGPLPDTRADFLRILYQQQTKTLVMLTDCKENETDYCSQYWGDEKIVFGEMEIEVKKTESFPAYVKRRLEIQSTKKKEVLEVDQYQFLRWKNSELPENAQDLMEMMRHIRESGGYNNSKTNRNIPIVVHCQNGSARTGIFCALWNIMDSASTEKLVDILQAVKNVRRERQGMIQTFEQYQFLYEALEGAFSVQNGGVKSPASDSLQIINETQQALLSEPASSTGPDQKEEESNAKESTEKEDTPAAVTETTSAEPSPAEGASEITSTEGTTNGPAVTVDV